MGRLAIIISIVFLALFAAGCNRESPEDVVGKYIEALEEAELTSASNYCTGDARLLTLEKIGRG